MFKGFNPLLSSHFGSADSNCSTPPPAKRCRYTTLIYIPSKTDGASRPPARLLTHPLTHRGFNLRRLQSHRQFLWIPRSPRYLTSGRAVCPGGPPMHPYVSPFDIFINQREAQQRDEGWLGVCVWWWWWQGLVVGGGEHLSLRLLQHASTRGEEREGIRLFCHF